MTAPTEPTAAAAFTLVFAGDLRKFPTNPHHVDTPFGRPIASGIGNAFEIMDALAATPPPSEADAALVAEATRYLRDYADGLDESGAYNHAANVLRFTRRLAARLQAAPPSAERLEQPAATSGQSGTIAEGEACAAVSLPTDFDTKRVRQLDARMDKMMALAAEMRAVFEGRKDDDE